VDDSIVRGNTLKPIVALLREAGAREIHVRIAAPPLTHPCYLGVDMASRGELIANRLDESGMAAHVGADSLYYVSIDGLLAAVRGSRGNQCLACFTGQYPLEIEPGTHPHPLPLPRTAGEGSMALAAVSPSPAADCRGTPCGCPPGGEG
jgi:amidophosphoribosyltransferase